MVRSNNIKEKIKEDGEVQKRFVWLDPTKGEHRGR